MKQLIPAVITAFMLLTTGCSPTANNGTAMNGEPDNSYAVQTVTLGMKLCQRDRPSNCTRDYKPVCAQMQDGDIQTYANSCTACADAMVTGYNDGAC